MLHTLTIEPNRPKYIKICIRKIEYCVNKNITPIEVALLTLIMSENLSEHQIKFLTDTTIVISDIYGKQIFPFVE